MTDNLKYRLLLNRVFAKQERAQRDYGKRLLQAKKQKEKPDKIEMLLSDASLTYDEYQDEITSLVTQHLLRRAKKLLLPIPDYSHEDLWEHSGFSNRLVLTEKGIFDLKSKIRSEEKENLQLYLPWVAAITGVIGALTGFFAIILRLN